jgi:sugar phosphate isomerase/epimerase
MGKGEATGYTGTVHTNRIEDTMADWAVGLSTGCLSRMKFVDSLELVRGYGFEIVEVCSIPEHLDYHDEEEVSRAARRLRELSMEPYSFHAPFAPDLDITSMVEGDRRRALDEIHHAARAAALLGVKYFVLHPGPETGAIPTSERLARMHNAVEVLDRVVESCRELGIQLVLENMLPHLFSGPVRDLLWLLGALDTSEVGICLDTGHAKLAGDLATVVHKLSGHLWALHASDTHGERDDHLPPGDGVVDWERLLRQLDGVRYRGAIILEIAGTEDPHEVMAAAQRGRRHIRRIARRLEP